MNIMWYVYMVRCSDNSLYTGITIDVERRVNEHNSSGKGAGCTRSRQPVKLVYREVQPDRSSALKREAGIKRMSKQKKEELVSSK